MYQKICFRLAGTLMLLLLSLVSLAQKKVIDFKAIAGWAELDKAGNAAISDDRRFVMLATNSADSGKIIIRPTTGRKLWTMVYKHGFIWIGFTKNDKAVFSLSGDSVWVLTAGTKQCEFITSINDARLIRATNRDWLIGIHKSKELIAEDLIRASTFTIPDISGILAFQNNSSLICTDSKNGSTALKAVNLQERQAINIWRGKSFNNITFNSTDDRLVFLADSMIWYYQKGMDKAIPIVSAFIHNGSDSLSVRGFTFSEDNRWLFVQLEKKSILAKNDSTGTAKVDVWNYKDSLLQSEQLFNLLHPRAPAYTGVISLENITHGQRHPIKLITQDDEKLLSNPEEIKGDEVLVIKNKGGDQHESWWNRKSMPMVLLESLVRGERTILKNLDPQYGMLAYSLSPSGKYVVYFDNQRGTRSTLKWYSYEIAAQKIRCLTNAIHVPFNLQADEYDFPEDQNAPYGLVGWVNDDAVLLKDQYDIWQVNLDRRTPAINLTEGYGRKHLVKFDVNGRSSKQWQNSDTIQLTAFSGKTKWSGYFTIETGKQTLKKIAYGPYHVDELIKSKNAETYLIQRETASDAPNWFLIQDGKQPERLTNLQPQKEYNWLTSELVTWKTFDGRPGQGILYKPENFDPKKKYPVIVHYYEQKSNELYEFKEPGYSGDQVNIPYMVSIGYLVFVPDIHYQLGKAGECAYNYIQSGAEYIAKLPYVDAKHMGLQGHSFGGYETNYMITHSHLFAAAVSASGWADFITDYNSVLDPGDGRSRQDEYEISRGRIGATLWQRPDLYINNSPIFKADKITTPLLMMNNKKDDNIHFESGVEFFTALRRLQKPVWMLQYDGEGHSLSKLENRKDYTLRMKQFFDHYLKGEPAPIWMTRGIPASEKGNYLGYEYDKSITN